MNATAALPSLEPLLTAADVAKFLKVSRRTVYQLHRDGELASVSIGAAVRFQPAAVRAYIERLARPPATVLPIRETMPAGEG